MTLIVMGATKDYIVQVADRRISVTRGKRNEIWGDDETKAIVFCNSAIIGYTGLAYADIDLRVPTDLWLCDALAGSFFFGEQLAILQERAQATFAHRQMPMAFAAVAWDCSLETLDPYLAIVSNFYQIDGKACQTGPDFNTLICRFNESKGTLMHTVGAAIDESEDDELDGILYGLSKHKLTIEGALDSIAEVIRRVADRDNTVGKGIVMTAIPRQALTGRAMGICSYMPADSNSAVSKAPHLVCGGGAIMHVESTPIE